MSVSSFPKYLQQAGLGHAESGSLELHTVSPIGGGNPSTLDYISSKLNQQQGKAGLGT